MLAPGQSRSLKRGGLLIGSSAGPLQIGAVPETIKDTMMSEEGVPEVFIMPRRLFSAERAISLAELEFPIYYNFFLRSRKTRILCRAAQLAVLKKVMSQSLFGPDALDPEEFTHRQGLADDLRREMASFRKGPDGRRLELDEMVDFLELTSEFIDIAKDVKVGVGEQEVIVLDKGVEYRFAECPPLPAMILETQDVAEAFHRPILGVSVLGSGHGFDPGHRTSGFILWIDGHGVMVDPPVDSAEWMRRSGIGGKHVDVLLLTHCHADHDAGALQKIMQEGRISLITTPSILANFVGKYAALLAMSEESFKSHFDFIPIQVGSPLHLHGAELHFSYSLHSIPCVGFTVHRGGKSLAYPSDTLNDPVAIQRLCEEGVISPSRRDELLAFSWDHDLIIHEAGVPPIHTPVRVLDELDPQIKKRLLLVHVSESSLAKTRGLRVAPTGLENTIDLKASREKLEHPLELLETMARVDLFSDLPLARAAEFLRMIRRENYKKGDKIVRQGEAGNSVYVILSGVAAVVKDGRELKTYGDYDYFGETALVLNQTRVADVIARTPLDLLSLERLDFLYLIRGSNLEEKMMRLAAMRERGTWGLLKRCPELVSATSAQLTQLQSLMEPIEYEEGYLPEHEALILEKGRVVLEKEGVCYATWLKGNMVADVEAICSYRSSLFHFRVVEKAEAFRFQPDGLRHFLEINPGIRLKLLSILPALSE